MAEVLFLVLSVCVQDSAQTIGQSATKIKMKLSHTYQYKDHTSDHALKLITNLSGFIEEHFRHNKYGYYFGEKYKMCRKWYG